ncbi:MAG: YggT family protein [Clostridiales bacterium]|nr:YggT family protein [Clostridia bacterium]MCR4882587.1 YggT family protein [Clostridiales bacterium]
MRLIMGLIDVVFNLFNILLLIYVLLSWIHPVQNKWTELVRSLVEPVLTPVRRFLQKNVPNLMGTFDWSPVALWLLISLIRQILSPLRYF